tara:strand:- start:1655 stop:2860 length:1206 start_codon:yes stop_codon:yes gene_type:complete
LRILIISQYFYPENFRINDLCIGLKELGHSVSVLTAKPNYPKGSFIKGYDFFNKPIDDYKGIKVFRSPIIPRGNGSGIRLFINYISFVFFGILRLLFINEKFDKIFVYAPSPITVGYIGVIASWKFRAKPYLWVHDLWPESVKDAGGINNKFTLYLIDLMTRSIYSFYEKILVQSPFFKKYLRDQSVDENKVIYYPYYAEKFYKIINPKAEIKSLYGDGLNLLFAGNIGVAQNFDTIVEAARILKNRLVNFKFIIIGDGRDKKRIITKISEYSLTDNFKFLGSYPPEKMSDFFACADALIVTLKDTRIFSMTIPGKLQSYLASGKPIIASLNGIGAKIIIDSKSGFVSNSEDIKDFANSIIRFNKLSDYKRQEFGLNGRKYFEKEFERSKLLKRLIDIFEQ